MAPDSSPSKRSRFRVDLRSLFVLTFCLAIGFTIGGAPAIQYDSRATLFGDSPAVLNWHFAMLAAASTSIAFRLVQESRSVWEKRQSLDSKQIELRFGFTLESTCRMLLSALLFTCLASQILISRGYVELPEEVDLHFYGDVFTKHVWWLALGIALTDLVSRTRRSTAPRPRRLIDALVWIAAIYLGLKVVWDPLAVWFLVHLACRGVDATLVHTGNRYPIWTEGDETRFLAIAVAASLIVLLAALLLATTLPRQTNRPRLFKTAIAAAMALLGMAAAYNVWFYRVAFPAVSPDLASVGLCSSWFEQLGGAILAAVAVAYASYRMARAAAMRCSAEPVVVESTTIASMPTIVFLLFGVAVYGFQMIWDFAFSGLSSPWEGLAYLLVYPDAYFMLAISVLSLQLGWLSWKGRGTTDISVLPLQRGRFATALVTLTALVAVAIPTVAAFGFAFWLGPWYRW